MRRQNLVCSLSTGGVSAGSPVAGTEFATSWEDRLRILEDYRRIAMVGLSSNPYRPSHFAARYLLAEGYDVIPVNPREQEILGHTCYPSLRDIPGPIEVVDIFRAAQDVPPIVEEAIEVGAKVVWMQFGIIHYEAAKRAREAGLEVVMDQCMKVEHARFFGRLNMLGLNSGVVSSRRWSPTDGKKT
ncbi:MAG TPA: CoA-binding protein [Bryobacterales bacterium]|nr:CoA-binding protein [Bryobacterales bacterium]